MFLHSHQLLVLKSYSSKKVFVQINPRVMPGSSVTAHVAYLLM